MTNKCRYTIWKKSIDMAMMFHMARASQIVKSLCYRSDWSSCRFYNVDDIQVIAGRNRFNDKSISNSDIQNFKNKYLKASSNVLASDDEWRLPKPIGGYKRRLRGDYDEELAEYVSKGSTERNFDDPGKAVEAWFKLEQKHRGDVAIMCEKTWWCSQTFRLVR